VSAGYSDGGREGKRAMALEHTAWRLTRMVSDRQTVDMGALDGDERSAITAAFEPDDAGALRIAGRGGCNRYTGGCTVAGNTLAIGAVSSTRMMCAPEAMEREARYFHLLGSAQRYEQVNGSLTIFCQRGELHFTQAEAGA
jgi:heat shock protein HslJ